MHIKVNQGIVRTYLTLVAKNGEILMVSQKYYSHSNALRAARKLAAAMGGVKVVS